MKGSAVRDIYEAYTRKHTDRGVANREFAKQVMNLVETKKIGINDLSFKELWEGLVVSQNLEEALTSSAFPNISSQIISTVMIEAYNLYPKIGLGMVRVVPSRLKVSRVVGWKAIGTISQVTEGEDFNEIIPPDEKYVLIPNYKYGGLLSLTKEDIFFDRTGQLVDRARGIGEEAARFQEQLILEGMIDKNGTVYNKGQMYPTNNSKTNYHSGAASALGTTSWETTYIALLKKVDEQGKFIWVNSDRPTLMVPPALYPQAFKLKNNEYGPTGTARGNDVNPAMNMFDIAVNPYLTAVSSTAWLYGAFKRQFRWEEVWPIETFSRVGQDSEDGFKRDVIQQFKASLYGGIGADDFKYVEYNAGA